MFQGLRTVIYLAPDLARAKAWYAALLGFGPYFDEVFYAGFNVGGFELGLVPDGKVGPAGAGVVAYWGVPDVAAAVARGVELGGTVQDAAHEVGGGIIVATLLDPFGNAIGLIFNPHFDLKAVR